MRPLVLPLYPEAVLFILQGPPVLNDEERLVLVESVKWVDEVITGEERVRV
jgi:glycerol-3-phosphate cytidylyltransferase-like family protein